MASGGESAGPNLYRWPGPKLKWIAAEGAERPGWRPGPVATNMAAMFLGEDLLAWLVLAIGGAMVAGNLAALLRPPEKALHEEDLEQAPLIRSVIFIVVGAVAAVWALASLIAG